MGKTIGEGNWSHPVNEVIPFEYFAVSDWFDASLGWSDAASYREPQGDSFGVVSAQCVAVMVGMTANDSGSGAATARCYFGPNTTLGYTFYMALSGLTNDAPHTKVGWIYLDYDEFFYYSINASGSGTFDIGDFNYKGIMVR